MKLVGIFLLICLFSISATLPVLAQERESAGLTDRETWLLYGELKEIRSFGIIAVSLVGDAPKIGLRERELTEYARDRFGYHFGSMKYEDISRDSRRFLELISTKDKKVGNITIRVWVIGEDYPVVYHIKSDAGNFDNPSIWTDEILGHGSKQSSPEAIRKIIDEMIATFAKTFYTIKGHGT